MAECNCSMGNGEAVAKGVLGAVRIGADFVPNMDFDGADCGCETVCKKVLGTVRITAEYLCSGDGGGDLPPEERVTIRLSETSRTLAPNGAFQLQAIVGPADLQDKSVTWISSDETVATVDQYGNVTAVGVGTVTITATTNVGGKTASSTVVVIERPEVYTGLDVLLPFGNTFDENLGSEQANITMYRGAIACDTSAGGHFDGEAAVAVNDYDFGAEWTMGCWVKFDELKPYTYVFLSNLVSGSYVGLQLEGQDRAYIYSYYINHMNSCNIPSITTNTWHHFALDSDAKLYVDGTHVATGTKGPSMSGTRWNMGIGNIAGTEYIVSRSVNGRMSNYFIARRLLTANEIGGMYAAGPTPVTL